MSKTERALTSSDESSDALDGLFPDETFDEAFDHAVESTNGTHPPAGDDHEADSSGELLVEAPDDEAVDVDLPDHDGEPSAFADPDDEAEHIDEPADVDVDVEEKVVGEVLMPASADLDAPLVESAGVASSIRAKRDAIRAKFATSLAEAPEAEPPEDRPSDPSTPSGAQSDASPTLDVGGDPADLDLSVTPQPESETDDAPTPVNERVVPLAPTARVAPGIAPIVERESDDEADEDAVSDKILDELRQAQIDGPVVAFAPQDDTTAARRIPKQSADYDPAPIPIPAQVPRVLGRKARVRKVTRVVRHVDPWSVFKIAIVANFVMYVIVLTASVLLWNVAHATGTVDNVERFFESFGWNSFEFNGGELYHAGWIAGLFVVIGLTGLAVLGSTLFNLITDLVGGVRFTVLEEEVVENRTSPMRRFVVRRAEPEVPAIIRDGSGAMYREAVVDDTGANVRPTR